MKNLILRATGKACLVECSTLARNEGLAVSFRNGSTKEVSGTVRQVCFFYQKRTLRVISARRAGLAFSSRSLLKGPIVLTGYLKTSTATSLVSRCRLLKILGDGAFSCGIEITDFGTGPSVVEVAAFLKVGNALLLGGNVVNAFQHRTDIVAAHSIAAVTGFDVMASRLFDILLNSLTFVVEIRQNSASFSMAFFASFFGEIACPRKILLDTIAIDVGLGSTLTARAITETTGERIQLCGFGSILFHT